MYGLEAGCELGWRVGSSVLIEMNVQHSCTCKLGELYIPIYIVALHTNADKLAYYRCVLACRPPGYMISPSQISLVCLHATCATRTPPLSRRASPITPKTDMNRCSSSGDRMCIAWYLIARSHGYVCAGYIQYDSHSASLPFPLLIIALCSGSHSLTRP